jgi:CO dehydrogenase nickel-insertion accessory protein CooC1
MDDDQRIALYLNLWSGEKGGVGKSYCCGLDCQRHIDRNQPFYLIDADRKNATVRSYYGDYVLDKEVFFTILRTVFPSA